MCKHPHWVIETTQSPMAEGQCTTCGKLRLFPNQLPFAVKYGRNDRKDITLVGSGKPQEYFERIAESFARDL